MYGHCQAEEPPYREFSRVPHASAGAGHDCYVVGGAIRDMLSDKAPQDVDILTSANHSRVRESVTTPKACCFKGRTHGGKPSNELQLC